MAVMVDQMKEVVADRWERIEAEFDHLTSMVEELNTLTEELARRMRSDDDPGHTEPAATTR